jgi:hypothetical protein
MTWAEFITMALWATLPAVLILAGMYYGIMETGFHVTEVWP